MDDEVVEEEAEPAPESITWDTYQDMLDWLSDEGQPIQSISDWWLQFNRYDDLWPGNYYMLQYTFDADVYSG